MFSALSRKISNAHPNGLDMFIILKWCRDCFLQSQQSLSQGRDTIVTSKPSNIKGTSILKPTLSASEIEPASQGEDADTLLPHRHSSSNVAAYHIAPAVIKSANVTTLSSNRERRSKPFSYGRDHTE